MKNYNRYKYITAKDYDKKGIMHYICRIPSDRKIIPLLSQIRRKQILDVGIGTGYYAGFLANDNEITGVDQNPHLCTVPVKVFKADATSFSCLFKNKKFDIVFSTWMTEYLSDKQLKSFIFEAKKVLKHDGKIIFTIISNNGWGFLYIKLANILKGIVKYNYKRHDVLHSLKRCGFSHIKMITLHGIFGIPWAFLVIAK